MRRSIIVGVIAAVAAVLSGCGGGGATTTTTSTTTTTTTTTTTPKPTPAPTPPPKPTPAPTPRPKPTAAPTLAPTKATVDCSQYNKPKPTEPKTVQDLNGQAWPDACFNEDHAHFFVLGDWGGLCNYGDNACVPNKSFSVSPRMKPGAPGMPLPMPNREPPKTGYYTDFEPFVQAYVRDRMYDVTKQLKAAGSPPKFIINVGDNFYPGGIDTHCGSDVHGPGNNARQFEQIWGNFYEADKLENMEWWGVLGNHDYGGVCYIKGWDQQIRYTWNPNNSRWVMPGQYWRRKVHFAGFTVEYFFVDGNYYDIMTTNPAHNMCTHDPDTKFCPVTKYPPKEGTDAGGCPVTGPTGPSECHDWFSAVWNAQYDWLSQEVPKSDADWIILVNHYPPTYNLGQGAKFMEWHSWLDKNGVDLVIAGHTHEQGVHYKDGHAGVDFGDTAFVISGGGGGITSEPLPVSTGHDDAYGFMDFNITKETITITAYSHGGTEGAVIIRNQTVVTPNKKKLARMEAYTI